MFKSTPTHQNTEITGPEAHRTVAFEDGVPVIVNDHQSSPTGAPAWERYLKRAVAVVVIACGSAVPFLSPTEDALQLKVCSIIVAVGAGLGITSRGNPPKQ